MSVLKFKLLKFEKTLLFQISKQSNTAFPIQTHDDRSLGILGVDKNGDTFLVATVSTIQLRNKPLDMRYNVKYAVYLRGANDIRNNLRHKVAVLQFQSNLERDEWHYKFINAIKFGVDSRNLWRDISDI